MRCRKKLFFLIAVLCAASVVHAQDKGVLLLKVFAGQAAPIVHGTAELLDARDSSLVKAQSTDSNGKARFEGLDAGTYLCRVSCVGYQPAYSGAVPLGPGEISSFQDVVLKPVAEQMEQVTVRTSRPFIEMQPGKIVVNVEASPAGIGATAMEMLEKLPGITVDKNGAIALKGRTGVTVMIDGKLTYLDPSQLATMLNGMSASQVSQVEIMDNPSARYDAAGNAGIINIKTKKNRQKGFNGSVTTAYTQGRYSKFNGNLQLNYRNERWNFTASYSANDSRHFTRIYALRTYYEDDDKTVLSYLEQPSMIRSEGSTHILRTGVDYFLSSRSTLGLTVNGLLLDRQSKSDNPAEWKGAGGGTDSLVRTYSSSLTAWKNLGGNLNFRHVFAKGQELSADIDLIGYRMRGDQLFENRLLAPSTYTEATKAYLPGDIGIFSSRIDYAGKIGSYKLETGAKTSRTTTDNLADYQYLDNQVWEQDLGKTNHFIYKENIHAVYASLEKQLGKLTVQGGLRYELTDFDARQLGNAIVKDSFFSRSYNSLFPTALASFEADSLNSFSFSVGRRIDRPPFQKLNPFLFIINKYTYEKGNPFYRPQYTWNMELSHSYGNKLITGLSYSITRDYFSQVFPIDSNGIVLYSVGNLGSLRNFGLSAGLVVAPRPWWSLNFQAVLNHKVMKGVIDRAYKADITQFSINMSNQFRFGKRWTAELSGFYVSKSQHDIQEIVEPAGQLSAGLSKTVLKSKGTVRLAARDLFYTQWMKGLTHFTHATEYFKLTRDTRVVSLSFSYRFGKSFKTLRRSAGAAGDEVERVGL